MKKPNASEPNSPPKNRGRAGMGHPPFMPTKEQRNFVTVMINMNLTQEEIASLIINPHTDKSIDKHTLQKAFNGELATGRSRIKSVVGSKLYQALEAGEQWAINFGLRHFNKFQNEGTSVTVSQNSGVNAEDAGIQVTFVRPTKHIGVDD